MEDVGSETEATGDHSCLNGAGPAAQLAASTGDSSVHLEDAASPRGCPRLSKAGGAERNRRGGRTAHPKHAPRSQESESSKSGSPGPRSLSKTPSLGGGSGRNLGALVSWLCSAQSSDPLTGWSTFFTLVCASHPPLPHTESCHVRSLHFQARSHFLFHSGSHWEPSFHWLLALTHFIFVFDKNTVFFPEWLSQHALWIWGRERRSPACSSSPSFLAFPRLLPTAATMWTALAFGGPTSHASAHTQCVICLTYADAVFTFYATGKG